MIPLHMITFVAPCFEIPANTWTFGGCLWQYLSFLGASVLRKAFFLWHLSWTLHSSVKMRSLNCSSFSRHLFTHSTLFCLFASRIAWQYLAVVNVHPNSLRALATLTVHGFILSKFLDKQHFQVWGCQLIIVGHGCINEVIVSRRNCFHLSNSLTVVYRSCRLPSGNSVGDGLMGCEYSFTGQGSLNLCFCHSTTGPQENYSSSLILTQGHCHSGLSIDLGMSLDTIL